MVHVRTGPDHPRLRAVFDPAFRAPAIAYLKPRIYEVANALLDKVNLLLFGNGMSATTRSILKDALADPDFPRTGDKRVLDLLWLASLSPEAAVLK